MILVTGATGLVGGHLLWHLLQDNKEIVALKRTESNLLPLRTIFLFYTQNPDIYLNKIKWVTGDVLNEASLQTAFQNIKKVYHCAAVVSLGNGSDAMIKTNVQGTRNIVNAALKANVEKFCFVSSIAACGHATGEEMIDENTTWTDSDDRSAYSKSKYYSEAEVWKGIKLGLNAVIVNPGVILGISGTSTGSSQLFAQVQKGLMFYTNGGSGYVDVKDVVKTMIHLTNSQVKNERFILVGENCSNKEILSWMADGFGKSRPWIGINRNTLLLVGYISEMVAKIIPFKPLIDKGMARSATNREFYSNNKIMHETNITFTPIKDCIAEVCAFMLKD